MNKAPSTLFETPEQTEARRVRDEEVKAALHSLPTVAENATVACQNTDRELWREIPGDYYSPSIHVTSTGGICINVGGLVIVKSPRQWHALAKEVA